MQFNVSGTHMKCFLRAVTDPANLATVFVMLRSATCAETFQSPAVVQFKVVSLAKRRAERLAPLYEMIYISVISTKRTFTTSCTF